MGIGIAETGIARGSPPGTTTEVLRVGFPPKEIRVVSQQENENKMHWISWVRLCKRKKKGGLGFRDLHLFNLTMLARQG
jgi:hypothetical protein